MKRSKRSYGMKRTNVVRDGAVHVKRRMCETCIFRPGNLMDLKPGRVAGMVEACLDKDGIIPCHETLYLDEAICRGFFDRHERDIFPLRMARPLGVLREV